MGVKSFCDCYYRWMSEVWEYFFKKRGNIVILYWYVCMMWVVIEWWGEKYESGMLVSDSWFVVELY